jgi:hypothetical protein
VDLIATLQVMLRRWYVVGPVLLLTGVAVLLVYGAVQPTYEARGTVIMRSAAHTEDPRTGARNQYADYGNLSIPARVVTDALSQETSREQLKQRGVPGDFAVGLDAGSLAPIITVVGTAPTPAEAIETTRAVMVEVDKELTRRQEQLGAPRITFLATEVVAAPTEAVPLNGSRLRAGAGVLVLGLIVALVAGFTAEAIARRRDRADASRLAGAGGTGGGDKVRAAYAFECGLCGDVFPRPAILSHLVDEHGLGPDGKDVDALLARSRDDEILDEPEPDESRRSLARRLRSSAG